MTRSVPQLGQVVVARVSIAAITSSAMPVAEPPAAAKTALFSGLAPTLFSTTRLAARSTRFPEDPLALARCRLVLR